MQKIVSEATKIEDVFVYANSPEIISNFMEYFFQISGTLVPKNLNIYGTNIPTMSAIRDHKRRIEEHMDAINGAISIGLEKKPVTIGLHTSSCAMELLEMYLHKKGKIPIGKIIKHDWFKKPLPEQKVEPLVERKLKVDFPDKDEIYSLIYDIENNRSKLVYGRASKTQVEIVVNSFMKLKQILDSRIGETDE